MSKKSNYLKTTPKGEPLGHDISSVLASFCDEELPDFPQFNHIPTGLILLCVVTNQNKYNSQEPLFEAALICDTEEEWERVNQSICNGDKRPIRYFLVKREWVRQMTDKPLASDQE
jgi:hypothetical protein